VKEQNRYDRAKWLRLLLVENFCPAETHKSQDLASESGYVERAPSCAGPIFLGELLLGGKRENDHEAWSPAKLNLQPNDCSAVS
jgi:hypothetical protein